MFDFNISFYPDGRPCNGFKEALTRYREIVPHLKLAGPTSFAPIIETAIGIVENSGGLYHVLIIIADGQAFWRTPQKPFRQRFYMVKPCSKEMKCDVEDHDCRKCWRLPSCIGQTGKSS